MNSLDKTDLYWTLFRFLGGGGLFIFSWVLLYWARRDGEAHLIFFGVGGLVISGKLLAPMVAEQLSRLASIFYSPGTKLSKPPPAYSRARGHRAFFQYEEALSALWEVLALHPQDLEAWKELIEIALIDLRDPARARAIFLEGRRTLKAPERVRHLEEIWSALGSRAVSLGILERGLPSEGKEPSPIMVLSMPSQEVLDHSIVAAEGVRTFRPEEASEGDEGAAPSIGQPGALHLPELQALAELPGTKQ